MYHAINEAVLKYLNTAAEMDKYIQKGANEIIKYLKEQVKKNNFGQINIIASKNYMVSWLGAYCLKTADFDWQELESEIIFPKHIPFAPNKDKYTIEYYLKQLGQYVKKGLPDIITEYFGDTLEISFKLAKISKEFLQLLKWLKTYANFNLDFYQCYSAKTFGKRGRYDIQEPVKFLCTNPEDCSDFLNVIRMSKTSRDKITADYSEKWDKSDYYHSREYETECYGSMYKTVKVTILSPSGKVKAEIEMDPWKSYKRKLKELLNNKAVTEGLDFDDIPDNITRKKFRNTLAIDTDIQLNIGHILDHMFKNRTYASDLPQIQEYFLASGYKYRLKDYKNLSLREIVMNLKPHDKDQILDLSWIDITGYNYVSGLFRNVKASVIDLTGWNTSTITDMSGMFAGCKNLECIKGQFDTSSLLYTTGMFSGCKSLKSVDFSTWDISNIDDMSYMFNECPPEIIPDWYVDDEIIIDD